MQEGIAFYALHKSRVLITPYKAHGFCLFIGCSYVAISCTTIEIIFPAPSQDNQHKNNLYTIMKLYNQLPQYKVDHLYNQLPQYKVDHFICQEIPFLL